MGIDPHSVTASRCHLSPGRAGQSDMAIDPHSVTLRVPPLPRSTGERKDGRKLGAIPLPRAGGEVAREA